MHAPVTSAGKPSGHLAKSGPRLPSRWSVARRPWALSSAERWVALREARGVQSTSFLSQSPVPEPPYSSPRHEEVNLRRCPQKSAFRHPGCGQVSAEATVRAGLGLPEAGPLCSSERHKEEFSSVSMLRIASEVGAGAVLSPQVCCPGSGSLRPGSERATPGPSLAGLRTGGSSSGL